MKDENEKQISLDILKHIEKLSDQINSIMSVKTKSVFRRYPLTFMLFILVGVVAVSEGLKEIITHISFFDGHTWKLFFAGIVILIATGTVYQKLDK